MRREVIKTDDGRYGWRLRDENDEIVRLPRLGTIHLPPDPVAEERSRLAVQEALRQQYEAQRTARA